MATMAVPGDSLVVLAPPSTVCGARLHDVGAFELVLGCPTCSAICARMV